ncbi:MAG: hypothetical protein ACI94Y_003591 [Maribacter sp.]|jgi:hypothetical protein
MKFISTEELSKLPDTTNLKRICKAISILESIICSDWEYRYYSFQKNWNENQSFCEMRNGEGDQMLILFSEQGIVINGFAKNSQMNGWKKDTQKIWKGIVDELPNVFHEFIFGEPVKGTGTTFCIWNLEEENEWEKGIFEYPNDEYKDGSIELLKLLDGNPETFKNWAEDYYEEEFEDFSLNIKDVEKIFNEELITKELVLKINPNLNDFKRLKSDFDEIGCEYSI